MGACPRRAGLISHCLYTPRLCIILRITVLHLADSSGTLLLWHWTHPVHTTLSQWHPSSRRSVTVDVTCDVQRLLDLVVSQFLLIDGECPLDGHASLMIDILTVYIFSISTYTMLKINVHEGLFWALFWDIATNKRSWRFIFSNFINALLKINVLEGLFLAIFWNFATNKRSWRFIVSNFINVLLKMNVRLCSIRCHVCTMMVQMWHCI